MEKSFYPYLAAFMWTGALIVLGVFLRAKIKLLQTLLFPAGLIGGLLGFALMRFGLVGIPTSQGWEVLAPPTFSTIAFHLFAFSFVGIGLLKNDTKSEPNTKKAIRGALWMGWLFGLIFSVQALLGYGIFYLWQQVTNGAFFEINGFLLGAGFTQGPGQTQAYATVWEETYQIVNSIDIGLAFAAIGFLVAGVIGVPFAQYGLRRGWGETKSIDIPTDFRTGILEQGNNPACAHATTHPANVESIGFHFALMFFIYGLAYSFGLLWLNYFPIVGVRGIGLGYSFMWGMTIAMLVRKAMDLTNCGWLIDAKSSKCLTNTCVDLMICAIFMGIKPTALSAVFVPFTLSIVIGSILTLALCLWFGRRTEEHGLARAVTMFGYCTGTGASGLMLLRLVDPEYKTSVALEVGLMAVVTLVVFAPIYMTMPFAPAEGFPMIWIFVAVTLITPIIMFATKLIGPKKF